MQYLNMKLAKTSTSKDLDWHEIEAARQAAAVRCKQRMHTIAAARHAESQRQYMAKVNAGMHIPKPRASNK